MLVIAKAYNDEPIMRVCVGQTERVFYLLHPDRPNDGKSGVGFPTGTIFECDEHLFSRLRTAWESEDAAALVAAWKAAKPISGTG
jgi:hypothetical protein